MFIELTEVLQRGANTKVGLNTAYIVRVAASVPPTNPPTTTLTMAGAAGGHTITVLGEYDTIRQQLSLIHI